MDYTTVQALRRFGKFGATTDDVLLVSTIGAASRAIEKHCGRKFGADAEATRTYTVRYVGRDVITPFNGPILYLDEDLAAAASAITGAPTVTYLPANEAPYYAILNDDSSWDYPISVTGYWAYSIQPPPDIELCCLRVAKWMYEMRETTRADAAVVTDMGAVLLPAALPADVIALLAPYRKIRMAG